MKPTMTLVGSALLGLVGSFLWTPAARAAAQPHGAPLVAIQGCAVGQCFDARQMRCTGQACGRGLPRCGRGQICDRHGSRCSCLPTDASIPNQCSTEGCAGPCAIAFPCPTPPCPEVPVRLGQCAPSADGGCDCVPLPTATAAPPTPTPTPQCGGASCGGQCFIPGPPFPCPDNAICNSSFGPNIPVVLGECEVTSAGSCDCVPRPTPTAVPPPPTATPQCGGAMCGGPCVVSGPPFPCSSAAVCNEPAVPVRRGQCELTATGSCACVALPTATASPLPPTPTPQCGGTTCGGPCAIFPPCVAGGICPDYVIAGECRADPSGVCACAPKPFATPTPGCGTDADCNDGNPCTADRCVNGTCEHACVCLSANGAQSCCAGPAASCVRPCGTTAAGTCGGACPSGASCTTLPSASGACGCVSGEGGPCGGNVFAPAPVCAPGLVCQENLPDITGVCVLPNCIPLGTKGCSQTSDCCEPCGNGRLPPCGVCISGMCVGAP